MPALTWTTAIGVPGVDAGAREAFVDAPRGGGVERHVDRVTRRIRAVAGPAVDRRQQVPLVLDRMPRPQVARPVDGFRVVPAAALDVVADALAGAGGPRQPRAARAAVQVDDDVESRRAEPAGEPDVIDDPRAVLVAAAR